MTRFIIIIIALAAATTQGHAFDLNSILSGLGSASQSQSAATDSTATSTPSGTGSDLLGGLGSILSNITATTNFSLDDLTGTWNYSAPAVSFESDNALQKIGGAAAATTIENKMATYYNKLGFNAIVLTIDADHNFTMTMKYGSLKGSIAKSEAADGKLAFKFSALDKISLGEVAAMAKKSGSTLTLTFDISKLVEVLRTVNKYAKNSTLSTVESLLSSYDGIYAGFKLTKQQ